MDEYILKSYYDMWGTCKQCNCYTIIKSSTELCYSCNNTSVWNVPQSFNYECPDCHGKFTTPVSEETGETELMDIKEIGTPDVIIYQKIVPVLRYVCPFCERLLKGLK